VDKPDFLIASLMEEDRLLHDLLQTCSAEQKEQLGRGGALTVKETLGHLAFWDSFAVRFFLARLDTSGSRIEPPLDFDQRSRQELERVRALPYPEILDLYRRATRDLVGFLRGHWHLLSAKQRRDFLVPLKHRRHHRLLLAKAFAEGGREGPRKRAGHA
jgi:hypothetical protein